MLILKRLREYDCLQGDSESEAVSLLGNDFLGAFINIINSII